MAISSYEVSKVLKTMDQLRFSSKAKALFDKMITDDPDAVLKYCREAGARGNAQQEQTILNAGGNYVSKYMKERGIQDWPEAVPLFTSDPDLALWYAMRSGQPHPEGEAAIATNPRASFIYATEVLNGRFEAGEAAIKTKPGFWSAYQELIGGN